jgi:uncharacterized protein (TIGR00255 family)
MKSMTGFGKARESFPEGALDIEIKTVNQRFFKFRANLPDALNAFERDLEQEIKKKVVRGSVYVLVSLAWKHDERVPTLDRDLVAKYLKDVRALQKKLKVDGDITIDSLIFFNDTATTGRGRSVG